MFATFALMGVVLAAPIPKEPAIEPPQGQPPRLAYFKAEGDVISTTVNVTEAVPVQKTVEVTKVVNNVPVKETVTVTELQPVTKTVMQPIDVKTTKYKTVDGNELTTSEAIARLKNGAICVVTNAGQPFDPVYLKIMKPETVVITLATPTPQPRPANAPVPGIRIQPLRVLAAQPVPLPAPVPEKKG